MREEATDVFVEADKNVLNLVAAWAEFMANVIHTGIADSEKIGSLGTAQMQSVNGLFRKFRQSCVRIGAARPLVIERIVRLGCSGFSAQWMRKS